MIKLSILICTVHARHNFYDELHGNILEQMREYELAIELLTDDSITDSIGVKRTRLLQEAQGEYVCFIDDDDQISANYIHTIMEALHANPNVDCCSLKGVITTDGKDPLIFEHSLKYDAYRTNESRIASVKYERYPNHLNCIKSSIAKQFTFPDINFGEDTDFANQLHKSGKLVTEVYIDKVLYHYLYRTRKLELL